MPLVMGTTTSWLALLPPTATHVVALEQATPSRVKPGTAWIVVSADAATTLPITATGTARAHTPTAASRGKNDPLSTCTGISILSQSRAHAAPMPIILGWPPVELPCPAQVRSVCRRVCGWLRVHAKRANRKLLRLSQCLISDACAEGTCAGRRSRCRAHPGSERRARC